ncbi:hypothetical protein BDB01DRAFT_318338 [Pilobolus umbonatus]|nr:hypothetical protein BDB01DRAFT_318338 [Pilobolus umbonatus]
MIITLYAISTFVIRFLLSRCMCILHINNFNIFLTTPCTSNPEPHCDVSNSYSKCTNLGYITKLFRRICIMIRYITSITVEEVTLLSLVKVDTQ